MKLTRVSTTTPWERELGYARAVRGGDLVLVAGTVAADAEGRPAAGDAYGQARAVFRTLDDVLARLGSGLAWVLRLRVHYVDPGIADGFARALREAYPQGAPAVTAVRVVALVAPEFLLEVEADAVVAPWRSAAPAATDEGGD